MPAYETVGEYVSGLPADRRAPFDIVWRAIRALVPEGEEAMRYGMPTIRLNGRNLVHLGVMKDHLGFYPAPSGVRAFQSEIEGVYRYSKGAIQFPFSERPPLALVKRIVKFRRGEERAKKRKQQSLQANG